MKHKSVYESPITVINILKKYVFGKRLFFLSATLLTTSLLTFVRPLIIKGITDDGMLKANMQVIGGNPKFCVTAKTGANREKFIMGGRREKRLPPC